MEATKAALIAREPTTAPVDPRFPNQNQVRRAHHVVLVGATHGGAQNG